MEVIFTFFSTINYFLLDTLLGKIIVNLTTSFVFIFILLKIARPKILISSNICYREIEGQMYYVFKIVNMSIFDLHDVRFKLVKRVPDVVNSGKKINHKIVPVTLNANTRDHFLRYKRGEGYGDHAYLVRSNENIEEIIKDPKINVKLVVMGKHGLTNLTRIKFQDFTSIDQIHKNKEFKFGKSLDVM